jgi:pilus assembly protein FimV
MVSGKAIFAILVCVASSAASALGFGDFRSQVILGQPLSLAVPVSLAEGESLAADCASAEVVSGDVRLPAGSVRVRITQGRDSTEAVIRVSSSVPIEEPVINVTVSAGCPPRVTRTMVLLADPPIVSPTVAAAPTPTPEAPRASATSRPEPARPAVAAGAGAESAPGLRVTRPSPPPRQRAAAPTAPRPSAAVPASAAPERSAPRVAAAPRPASAPRAEGRPRLRLDEGQVSAGQAAVQAAEAQASAAREAAALAEAAASAAQARAAALEAEVAKLRADTKAQTDALVALRQQIAQDQAQRQQQAWLLPLLLAAMVALGLVAMWLAWRLRSQQQQTAVQREAWWDKAGPASRHGDDNDSGYRSSSFRPSSQQSSRIASAPAPLSGMPDPAPQPPADPDPRIAPPTVAAPVAVTIPPLPPRGAAKALDESSRAMSVDEQIDLEQQADFFIALGHDESAIDLLMAHLRSTGGGTPLPFLKLLEIHRRRGDREAYERTRVRFNQRFNSVAPDWGSDPRAGRTLVDYPLVVGRVQHAWAQPLDAMAEMEALLFRRGAGAEMFDLPAYQELLFLYQLARDLHQSEQPDDTDVDVLLPISGAAAAVPAGTITLKPEFNSGEAMSLDLDLTTDTGKLHAPEIPPVPAKPKPKLELDLSGDTLPHEDDAKDIWAADPGDRRRE